MGKKVNYTGSSKSFFYTLEILFLEIEEENNLDKLSKKVVIAMVGQTKGLPNALTPLCQ